MANKKLTKAERLAKIPIEDIIKSGGPEGTKKQIEILKTLAVGYKRRAASFDRKDIFSYAQDKYEAYHNTLSAREIKKLNFNQRVLEIAKLQSFFNSRTSSLKGIKEINREQDVRIFGADEEGTPLGTLDKKERKAYWTLYENFLNQNPIKLVTSERIQQLLGTIKISNELKNAIWDKKKTEDLPPEFMDIINKLKKLAEDDSLLNEETDPEEVGNVFMGRGPFVD